MKLRLKPVTQQTIVITGATSGIGLTTARMASAQGAKLVLTARDEETLNKIVNEIKSNGGNAVAVAADVADAIALQKVVGAAQQHFGGFDTWVNNAGVSIYGRLEEVSLEDARRLFDTNFWGLVNGSKLAVEHMRTTGGAIINVGSTLSERSIPLQGFYCASKHAVKGFTEALRMEIEEAQCPISVTLVKPSAIDTPYPEHAKNYLPEKPNNPPPVYSPDVVAKTILHCAAHPQRDVFVGSGGKALALGEKYAPRLLDKLMEATMFKQQQTGIPKELNQRDGLFGPNDGGFERGDYRGHVIKSSIYTKASLHPLMTGAVIAAAGLAMAALMGSSNGKSRLH